MNPEQLYSEFLKEAKQYRQQYEAQIPRLIQMAKEDAARVEYAKGGKTLHRGYYFPGLMQDIMVGNINRGRLLRKKMKSPDFCYYFDTSNILHLCESCDTTEVILRENDCELGLTVDSNSRLCTLSQCDSKNSFLQSYKRFRVSASEFSGLYIENYHLQNGLLTEVEVCDVSVVPEKGASREIVELSLKKSTLTKQEQDEVLFGCFFQGLHLIIRLCYDGEKPVSYTIRELPRKTVKEYPFDKNAALSLMQWYSMPSTVCKRTQSANRQSREK